jgi:hypothetical protein
MSNIQPSSGISATGILKTKQFKAKDFLHETNPIHIPHFTMPMPTKQEAGSKKL